MASLAHISCAALIVVLSGASLALAQDAAETRPPPLSISVEGSRLHTVGSAPQQLAITASSGGSPVDGARLRLGLVDAPETAYCACGEATTSGDGTFALEWGSSAPGAMTLRVDAEADGHLGASAQFVLSAVGEAAAPAFASLWTPPLMLEGETYEGVVVTEDAHAHGARILLTSADPGALRVEREATVHAGDNHAIFALYPLEAGEDPVEVFASINGPLVRAESRIYSQKSVPSRLDIVLPSNSTISDSMTAYVFVLDANGAPARVDSDTVVRLESGGSLRAPPDAPIPAGEFRAKFSLGVLGNGTLYAHAGGLESDSVEVTKAARALELRIAVAPSPVGQDSHATYHAWIEDDGRPHAHPGVLAGQVHTDNTGVAGFLPVAAENSESSALYMRNGVASGTVYTRGAGEAMITASIPDIGTASETMIVGAAYLPEGIDGDGEIEPAHPECSGLPSDAEVDSVRVWVHPQVTAGDALITVAPYHAAEAHAECAAAIERDDGDPTCGADDNDRTECLLLLHPMEVDSRRVSLSVSPSGAEYDHTVELTQGSLRSYATDFGVVARDVGNYTLAATATNVGTATATFRATPPNSGGHALRVEPLHVAPSGDVQEVALVSIRGPDGALVDAQDAFGRPKEITIAGRGVGGSAVMIVGDSAPFRASLEASTEITATAPGLGRGTARISLPGIVAGVDLEVPGRVHLHEEFPFAMHLVDSLGTPLSIAGETNMATSGLEVDWGTRRMSAQRGGNITMSVLAEHGAHEGSVDVFSNELDLDVRASAATARTGTPFRIDVLAAAEGIDIGVSSALPWERVEGSASIDVTAGVPGTFPVTITASKRGYEPAHETIHVTAEEYVLLDVSAAGSDGVPLEIGNVSLIEHAHDSATTESTIALPWSREHRDLASAEIEFPHEHDGGYVLASTTVNGHEYEDTSVHFSADGDVKVHATYERSVSVNATGGSVSGAGSHAYGARVSLVAEPTEIVPLLAYGVFESWVGLPEDSVVEGNAASFVAGDDVSVHAVYQDDYTGALAVSLAAMASLVAWRRLRSLGRISPTWALGELARRVRLLVAHGR